MHVADLGAGTGYFLPHLSRAVGKDGRVLGLDVEPGMVEYMERRITSEQMRNTRAQRVGTEAPGLAAASLDRILIVNTWHHLPNRVQYARQLSKALRPSGAVIIVDFTRESPMGPPEKYRFTVEQVTEELAAGGFDVQVLEESLPHQFVLRATPQ
jgi:ubiquinone/menaquinone biosynthesis C-methylase UbiE